MNLNRAFLVGVLMIVTLTSCTAPAKESEERDANGKKIEYVYYTPTGSNVPIRVRKQELQTSESDTATQQKALEDIERSGTTSQPPSNVGGR